MSGELTTKQKMRQSISASATKKREKKRKEREEKKEALKITRRNPFHRKHGSSAEKKRIDSMAHLSDRQKRVKKRNIDAGTPGKSTTKSKSTRVKGRKLSPYEQRQAERKEAMRARAKKKHEAWKASKGRK